MKITEVEDSMSTVESVAGDLPVQALRVEALPDGRYRWRCLADPGRCALGGVADVVEACHAAGAHLAVVHALAPATGDPGEVVRLVVEGRPRVVPGGGMKIFATVDGEGVDVAGLTLARVTDLGVRAAVMVPADQLCRAGGPQMQHRCVLAADHQGQHVDYTGRWWGHRASLSDVEADQLLAELASPLADPALRSVSDPWGSVMPGDADPTADAQGSGIPVCGAEYQIRMAQGEPVVTVMCTRSSGHGGSKHVAGDARTVVAVWPVEDGARTSARAQHDLELGSIVQALANQMETDPWGGVLSIDRTDGDWLVGYSYGREADGSPMAAGSVEAVAATLVEALRQVAEVVRSESPYPAADPGAGVDESADGVS